VTFEGPFNGTLPLFDSSIAQGYKGDTQLFKDDLTSVAKYYLNDVVRRNTGEYLNQNVILNREPMVLNMAETATTSAVTTNGVAMEPSTAAGATTTTSATKVGENVDSFATNNQEDNVDEADIIKSDGTTGTILVPVIINPTIPVLTRFFSLVFAAYGDYIVMWEARTGADLGHMPLPSMKEESGLVANDTYTPYWLYMKPTIRSLLLYENRLAVIAEGYGDMLRLALNHDALLSNYRGTRILVYDTSALANGGNLTLLDKKDINGYYSDARAIGTNIHVVTMSGINYYTLFAAPFDRWTFNNMTDHEYTTLVRKAAETEAIPAFVDGLTDEITIDGKLPNIARMSVMQTEWNASQADQLVYSEGVNNFYVQVSSFDISASNLQVSDTGKMNMTMTGAFLPFYGAQVYSAVDTMVIAAQGYDYVPNSWDYNEFTYLLALDLSGSSAETRAVGQVPGTLLNNYAVDVMDDILRIGTTVRDQGWCCGPWMPIIAIDPVSTQPVMDIAIANDASVSSTDSGTTTSVFSSPINTMSPTSSGESSTTNYISMLQIPALGGSSPGAMEILGQVELGKKDEAFTSIRFFDNIAYAVTFLKRDPFYVIDLSDPTDPQILGELNITGFSEYLHPMNDDNTLLLAIGQEADENGITLGLQISVLDARNPAKPTMAQRYLVEQDQNTYSSSESSWDFHAFRYDRQSERLILPVSINNWQDPSQEFHGFYVFVVNADEIAPTCRIQQADYGMSQNVCYYCAYFPSRSMIFNGNVTTVGGHFVRSTNLNTCASEWDLTISLTDPSVGCCGWFQKGGL
jgi:hypothetical protein